MINNLLFVYLNMFYNLDIKMLCVTYQDFVIFIPAKLEVKLLNIPPSVAVDHIDQMAGNTDTFLCWCSICLSQNNPETCSLQKITSKPAYNSFIMWQLGSIVTLTCVRCILYHPRDESMDMIYKATFQKSTICADWIAMNCNYVTLWCNIHGNGYLQTPIISD